MTDAFDHRDRPGGGSVVGPAAQAVVQFGRLRSKRGEYVPSLAFLFAAQRRRTAGSGASIAEPLSVAVLALVRECVSAAGGRELDTTVDSLPAVFPTVSSALSCAGEIGTRIADLHPDGAAAVRMGVHAGEPLEVAGGRFFGTAVWVAARLCGQAGDDEVLVSGTAAALAPQHTRDRLVPRGAVTLKGVQGPTEVFAFPTERSGPSQADVSARIISCLTVDQVGSTALIETLGDAGARPLHTALLDVVRESVGEHGGWEVEYGGDGVTAAFDSAVSASSCAVQMQQTADRHRRQFGTAQGLRLRIGIQTAEAIPADTTSMNSITVRAGRLCGVAHADRIVVSAVTAAIVQPRHAHQFAGYEAQSGLGGDDAVELLWEPYEWEFAIPEELAAVVDAAGFVGRGPELTWLNEVWLRAAAGNRQLVVVDGDGGVGKSALASQFARACRESHNAAVFYGRCAEQPTDPFGPLTSALAGYVGSSTRADLRRQLGDHLETVREVMPAVADRVGHPRDVESKPTESALITSPSLVARAMEALLTGAAALAPVLVVIDDMQWADGALLAVLRSLAESSGELRLMTLCLTREPEVGASPVISGLGVDLYHHSSAQYRTLRGLTDAEVQALIARVTGSVPSQELLRSIVAESDGVPYFVVHMSRNQAAGVVATNLQQAVARAETSRLDLRDVREEIASGVEEIQRLRAPLEHLQTATDALVVDPEGTPPAPGKPPYLGLSPFGAEDAEWFFGRDRLIAELASHVVGSRFVGVLGASGSGKSSLVLAGLLPTLASGALPGSERWTVAVLTPGSKPSDRLALAVAEALDVSVDTAQSAADAGQLGELVTSRLTDAGATRLIVVVDQFEELFTGTFTDDHRRFLDALLSPSATIGITVVAILRADFYGACATHPVLAERMREDHLLVGAMSDDEIRLAVNGPAQRSGCIVEPELSDAIVADVAGEPGALPLLSTALLETWHRRRGRSLTLSGYAETGGVRGAVARLAEDLYLGLPDDRQPIVRAVFMRLAELSSHGPEVRRRAERSEFNTGDARVRETVDYLLAGRLLTTSDTSVEVTHEALLREWPRLREWLTEARDRRSNLQELATAATAWAVSGRDSELLARGTRLALAGDLASDADAALSELEREYLGASVARRDAEVVAVRRTNRRLRRQLLAALAFLVLAVVTGVVALGQRSDARHQTRAARRQTVLADARGVAAQADALQRTEPDLALLLAVEANRLDDTSETRGGLLTVLSDSPHLERIWRGFGPQGSLVLPSPDGRVAAVVANDVFRLWNIASERPLTPRVSVPHGPIEGQWLNSDVFSTVSNDGSMRLWDGRTGQPVSGQFDGVPPSACDSGGCGTSPNGRFFFVDAGHRIRIWKSSGGRPVHAFANAQGAHYLLAAALNSTGTQFASVSNVISDKSGTVQFFNPATGHQTRRPLTIRGGAGEAIQYSPNGGLLAVGTLAGEVTLVDPRTGRPDGEPLLGHTARISSLAFSPNGKYLASAALDSTIVVWRVSDGSMVGQPFTGHSTSAIVSLGWMPDDRRLVSANADQVITWGLADRTALPGTGTNEAESNQGATDPQRHLFILTRSSPRLNIWDSQTLAELPGSAVLAPEVTGIAVDPVGDMLAASLGGRGNAVDRGIDLLTAAARPALLQHLTIPGNPSGIGPEDTAFSPSGRQLAVIMNVGELYVFNIGHPSELAYHEDIDRTGGEAVAWTNDGSRIIVAGATRLVAIDARTHRIASSNRPADSADYISSVDVEPGRAGIVATLDSGKVIFYNDEGVRTRRAALTATNDLFWSGLSPNGQLLAAGGAGGTIELWSLPSGKPLAQALPVSDGYTFPVFLDNDRLVVIGQDDTLNLVDTNPSDMIDSACAIAGRNLTHQEFDDYLTFETYHRTCPQWPADS